MKPIVIKPKSHKEWLKVRGQGIGASEVAAVIGLSPWDSPYSLWLKKTGQLPPTEETFTMKLGHLLEPIVVQLWEESTGFKAVKSSAADIIYQDPEKPWRKCTPDRIAHEMNYETGKKERTLIEIKTSSMNFEADDLPVYYLAQCQYQMLITGIHRCTLAWLTNGRQFGFAPVEWDEEFANFIGNEVDKFWNECVVGGKEPDLISVSDYAIKGSEPGTSVEADSEAIFDIGELRETNESISSLEAKQEALKDKLKLFMGEKEVLTFGGQILATWKSGKKGRTFLLKKQKEQ